MRFPFKTPQRFGNFCVLFTVGLVAVCTVKTAGGIFRNASVGGVSIDADGVLSEPTVKAISGLRETVANEMESVPDEMDSKVTLRKISLRQLEAALHQSIHSDLGRLPDEIKYLAGIQKIQYIFIYPEQQDIVLAGPGEGWTVDKFGQVVGKTTGQPVIQLEDLLVALQTARTAGEVGISCSIDPTEEGTRKLRQFVKQQTRFSPRVLDGMERSLGPQQITVTGVPETSHFARVLVAADYRMKRIAMQMDESPLETVPSFLQMLAASRTKLTNMMPRWWLACDYDPLARSDDGLAWELRGRGVKVMTEDDLVEDDGSVTVSGKKSPVAERWAEKITRHYDELSREFTVFAQLRNLMDLSVVAALIEREHLLERAGCELPTLVGENSDFVPRSWNPPKTVSTQCSFIKRGREYLITASGGVQIDSWKYASKSQPSKAVGQLKTQNNHVGDSWWWN